MTQPPSANGRIMWFLALLIYDAKGFGLETSKPKALDRGLRRKAFGWPSFG
jgi:hypothetical protein